MKSEMSNFHLRVVANTVYQFKMAMEIAFFDDQAVFVAKKYYDSAKSWKIDDGWLVLSRLGDGEGLAGKGLALLPMPMNHDQATNFAIGWLMTDEAKAARGPDPATDDETPGAFIIEATNSHVDQRHEIVRVKADWTLFVRP